MQNNIQIFENQEFGKVRAVEKDGQSWFVGKDVAEALGYGNTKDALSTHVDAEDKAILQRSENTTFEIPNRGITIINESGLYSLILTSKLPRAKAFKRWVTSDILPSIRKHQAYIAPETLKRMREDQTFADGLLAVLTDAQAINRSLVGFVEVMRPKADYYDSILQCPCALPVTIIAKDYGMTAQEFNKRLHFLRIQYKVHKTWVLYAAYANLGYTLSSTYLADGEEVAIHTQWTQVGRRFLYARLKQHGILPTAEALTAQTVMEDA